MVETKVPSTYNRKFRMSEEEMEPIWRRAKRFKITSRVPTEATDCHTRISLPGSVEPEAVAAARETVAKLAVASVCVAPERFTVTGVPFETV
jgi:hypothetical protein